MASNVFSRFLPADTGSPSIYETLRQEDESLDQSDVEQRAAMAVDEENLAGEFHDYELDDAIADAAASQSNVFTGTQHKAPRRSPKTNSLQQPLPRSSSNIPDTMEDDEVPESLLIEDNNSPVSPLREQQPRPVTSPIPGPATKATRAKWQATQAQQRLHIEASYRRSQSGQSDGSIPALTIANPRERAMWRWANVEDLDNFLRDVYEYFLGNGIWSILLSRLLNLL
ncbi:MAG: hypothetical protein Q9170_000961 [Blastenia crenularia]